MDFKKYFKKNKVKLQPAEKIAINLIGRITYLELCRAISPAEARQMEEWVFALLAKKKSFKP